MNSSLFLNEVVWGLVVCADWESSSVLEFSSSVSTVSIIGEVTVCGFGSSLSSVLNLGK